MGLRKLLWLCLLSLIIPFIFQGVLVTLRFWLNTPMPPGLHYTQFVVVMGFLLVDGYLTSRLKYSASEYRLARRFQQQFLLLILISALFLVFWEFSQYYLNKKVEFITLQSFWIKWWISVFMIAFHVVVQIGRELLTKWRDSLAESERFQKENMQSRLETLKSQINPHFLFNSLNTLSGLIYENPDQASAFLRRISGVYRHILDARDKDLIALSEEMLIVRDYIDLLHIRFPEMVKVRTEVEGQYRNWRIAPLSLQMLMENAIKHNMASLQNPLVIEIKTTANDGLSVKNNLQLRRSLESSTQVGLKNIKARYAHFCEREVKILPTQTHFEVVIPLIPPK